LFLFLRRGIFDGKGLSSTKNRDDFLFVVKMEKTSKSGRTENGERDNYVNER
jgi:hypothetical protein